ncbi:MAG: RNA polymerase factor sigma-54 [bacterium]|nr:RNA polymerase sigma-54 factor [Deltaproteobacteria bacterium]MCP4906084.1 RNA polymerase factor sigma-54 [bacterium]
MAIELKQQLRISQQLVMTPQLQQAIKLLQLNQLELVNLVQQELQENPVLEESDVEEETQAEREDATVDGSGTGNESSETEGATDEPLAGSELAADETPAEEVGPTDAEKIADVEWEQYIESHPMTGLESGGGAGEDDRPSLEATYARRPSLAEHLEWQLQVTDLDAAALEIARWVIGNIDDRGFLRSTVEEISCQAGAEESEVERVLSAIQRLDPIGVAARDLRECLLLQIDAGKIGNALVRVLVDEHVDLLQRRDFRGLVRVTGATLQEVADAARVIGGLEPRPGRGFGGEDPVYITPDIYVYKVGDDFHVLLNEDGLPKLKINSIYRGVLSKDREAGASDSFRSAELGEKDTKNYVHDKVRSAMWLIKSIHQRQRTIYKVMESIIEYQRDFFEHGVAHLKPLNLRDVADDIEMHESTVSRVTTNKYVHTPQGIYELKYFFNSSISRFDGEALASESVKEKIRRIIENEDSARPMSDQRIAEMLKAGNIDIARRTVTKYREAMNILSSTKRRQVC